MRVLVAIGGPAMELAVAAATEALDAGGCVALPTDTVYGLAAAVRHPEAVDRLFELKQRPARVPVAMLVADQHQARRLARFTPLATRLARRHWPGAVTLVLPATGSLAALLGSEEGTVGIRCPDHDLVRELAALVGPLATTSANVHGGPTPIEATAVASLLPGVDLVLDGGVCDGRPSTVVDASGSEPVVLRRGVVRVGEREGEGPTH